MFLLVLLYMIDNDLKKSLKACFSSPTRTYQVGVWYVNMVVT